MLIGDVSDDEEFMQDSRDIDEPNLSNYCLMQPPLGITPKDFINMYFGKDSDAGHMQYRKGTTTLAFLYEPLTTNDVGGIIVAADSRASAGEYISSKSCMKILDVSDRIVATMAGSAADCQFWTRIVAKYCKLYELREKTAITVAAASKYFSNVLYSYRSYNLQISSMVAGYDKRGSAIFMVNSEGQRVQLDICSVGSGSLDAYGVLDNFYKKKMSDDEAVKLARRAITLAAYRDSGSGGFCNMVHITPERIIRFPSLDVSQLFCEFADEIGRDIVYEPRDDN